MKMIRRPVETTRRRSGADLWGDYRQGPGGRAGEGMGRWKGIGGRGTGPGEGHGEEEQGEGNRRRETEAGGRE